MIQPAYSVLPRFKCLSIPMKELAVIVGDLNPNANDNILALCGSGDQAFALLEYAQSIHLPNLTRYVMFMMNKTCIIKSS